MSYDPSVPNKAADSCRELARTIRRLAESGYENTPKLRAALEAAGRECIERNRACGHKGVMWEGVPLDFDDLGPFGAMWIALQGMSAESVSVRTSDGAPFAGEDDEARDIAVQRLRAHTASEHAAINRVEAAWLQKLRKGLGIPDRLGEKLARGSDREVHRYLATDRKPYEKPSLSQGPPHMPEERYKVGLSDALRSPGVREACRKTRDALDLLVIHDHRSDRCPGCARAANELLTGLWVAGALRNTGTIETLDRLGRSLLRAGDKISEDSVMVRHALTAVGWTVAEAKAAVRAMDRESKSTTNGRRRKASQTLH